MNLGIKKSRRRKKKKILKSRLKHIPLNVLNKQLLLLNWPINKLDREIASKNLEYEQNVATTFPSVWLPLWSQTNKRILLTHPIIGKFVRYLIQRHTKVLA